MVFCCGSACIRYPGKGALAKYLLVDLDMECSSKLILLS